MEFLYVVYLLLHFILIFFIMVVACIFIETYIVV